jgi:hypothetical protein
MQKTILASTFAIASLALTSEAWAQPNLHTADVLRPGDNMLYGEIGWPDFTMGFQHGVSDKVDIGFALSVIYGYEYTPVTWVGMGFRVPIRITPVKGDKVSFQIHFDPGLKFDHFGNAAVGGGACGPFGLGVCGPTIDFGNDGTVAFGLWLYFGLDVGIHFTREATLSLGMEAPFYVNFTGGVYGGLPFLFGPAFEYDLNDHIGFGINAKFGPTVFATGCAAPNPFTGACATSTAGADFGFIVQPFFAYKL